MGVNLVDTVAMLSVVYFLIFWQVSFATFRVYDESTHKRVFLPGQG